MEPHCQSGTDDRGREVPDAGHTKMARVMKRRNLLLGTVCLLAACRSEPAGPGTASIDTAWVMPPTIESATREGESLALAGSASPMARVVVSAPGGPVFAASADARGRFRLVTPRPTQTVLLSIEVRAGEARYPAPGRLLVAGEVEGPIAFVSAGTSTRRFDPAPAPALDTVDSDGRSLILSGRAAPGTSLRISAGSEREVRVGDDGRWTAALSGQPAVIQVADRTFEPSLALGGPEGLVRSDGGWSLTWAAPDGARQTTWFPSRTSETTP